MCKLISGPVRDQDEHALSLHFVVVGLELLVRRLPACRTCSYAPADVCAYSHCTCLVNEPDNGLDNKALEVVSLSITAPHCPVKMDFDALSYRKSYHKDALINYT